jgi:hypothetical protein
MLVALIVPSADSSPLPQTSMADLDFEDLLQAAIDLPTISLALVFLITNTHHRIQTHTLLHSELPHLQARHGAHWDPTTRELLVTAFLTLGAR